MFYFHKVAYVQYLGEVDIFSYMSNTFLPLYNSAKTIKIDRDFRKLWSQMYCHLFYGSQCISDIFYVWRSVYIFLCLLFFAKINEINQSMNEG